MSDLLADIHTLPAERIFIVRKIGRLGFRSANILREHFEAQGLVDEVVVPDSHVPTRCRRFIRRIRPSNLAFVVMREADGVEKALMSGCEQVVLGHKVRIERYRAQPSRAIGGSYANDGGRRNGSWLVKRTSISSAEDSNEPSVDESVSICDSTDEDIDNHSKSHCEITGDFEYWATDDEWL